MIQIEMEMPERCADCPMIVKVPDIGVKAIWLCRNGWKLLETEKILEQRAEFCTIKKVEE